MAMEDDEAAGGQQADACPICLVPFALKTLVANPNECQHIFCPECINEWSKKTNTCPVDRKEFVSIRIKRLVSIQPALQFSKCLRSIPVDKRRIDDGEQDATFCEICGRSDREHTLLLCDDCDNGFHCECLNPPLHAIPEGFWFCDGCIERRERLAMMTDDPVQDVVNAVVESAANPAPPPPRRPRPVTRRRKVVKRRRKVKRPRIKPRGGKTFAKTTAKKYKTMRRKRPTVVRRKKRKVGRRKTASLIDQMPIEAPGLVEMLSKKEKVPVDSISDINAISFGQDRAWFTLTNLMGEVPIPSLEPAPKKAEEPVAKKDPAESILLLDKILDQQSKFFTKPKLTFKMPEKSPVQNKTPLSSTSISFNRHFRLTEKERPCSSGLSSSKSSSGLGSQKPVQVARTSSQISMVVKQQPTLGYDHTVQPKPNPNDKVKRESTGHSKTHSRPSSSSSGSEVVKIKLEPRDQIMVDTGQFKPPCQDQSSKMTSQVKLEPASSHSKPHHHHKIKREIQDSGDCVQSKPKQPRPPSGDDSKAASSSSTNTERRQPPINANQDSQSSQATTQDRVVEIAKNEIKPYYVDRKINKDQYKIVMKKVVKLALRDFSEKQQQRLGAAQEAKVRAMVHHYAKKFL